MDGIHNQVCPRCRDAPLNVYFPEYTDDKIGVWCENCNLKAYYCGETSVLIN